MIRLNEQEFQDIAGFIRQKYGINLDKKKVLIECRMSRELEGKGIRSFSEYLELLKKDTTGSIADEMVNSLTTNYTYFMREPKHFEFLNSRIFPELFERYKSNLCSIWCAGCSTGEECYTLAMLLWDYRERSSIPLNFWITASDISKKVLEKAEQGIYPIRELEEVPPVWRSKYCHIQPDGKQFCVDESLKRIIRFRYQNLLEVPPGSEKYDLILCRNVMIYFDRESKRQLIRMLEDSLNPGGYLLIGHAELLTGEETRLESVYPAVYRMPRRNK